MISPQTLALIFFFGTMGPIVIYLIYIQRKIDYFNQRLETYKGEKVLYQSSVKRGLLGFFYYFVILTNKKVYFHTFTPFHFYWEIENRKIKNIKYKEGIFPLTYDPRMHYTIKINNKETIFGDKQELDIFLERLKKMNKSIIIQGKKTEQKNFPKIMVSFLFNLGLIFPPIWVLMGIIGLVQIHKNPEKYTGKLLAWILISGGIVYTTFVYLLLKYI